VPRQLKNSVAATACMPTVPDIYASVLLHTLPAPVSDISRLYLVAYLNVKNLLNLFLTDVCMVWRHVIYPTTSSASLIPTAAVSGRGHPRSWWSDVHGCPLLAIVRFRWPGSRLWNSLPPDVTSAPTLTVFQ